MQAGADGNCPKIWRIQPYLEVSEALEVLDITVERLLSFHRATPGLHLGALSEQRAAAILSIIPTTNSSIVPGQTCFLRGLPTQM